MMYATQIIRERNLSTFPNTNVSCLRLIRSDTHSVFFFFFQAEDGIRDLTVTGVQTCALPICKEVATADIVKGVEFEEGRYVVLSAEEIAAAFPKTTQTIEIEAFVDAQDIQIGRASCRERV